MMQRKSLPVWLSAAATSVLWLAAAGASAADRAGSVQLVLGDAQVLQADGKARPLTRGDSIEAGQTLQTGASGHVHLQMVDGAFVSVRPKSRLRIEEYRYDAATPGNNRIKFVLEEGVARSITGKAGEAAKENYRMNTPLAAIGIRGTDFVVQASADVTRVTVQSGAIVMTPLSADCTAASLGPCQSATTRVLTAAMRNAYLELRNRNEAPMLVPAEKALESPNIVAPPAKEEPRVSLDKSTKVAGTPPVDTRDTVRDAAAGTITNIVSATPAPGPSFVTPPGITAQPDVAAAPATAFWWGRWSTFIGPDEAAKEYVAATNPADKAREFVAGNDVFGMRREAGDIVMPTSGVAKFTLADAEAYFMRDNKTLTAAAVSSPSLTIDFGNRRFETSLTMSAAGQTTYVLNAGGEVTFQGLLYNDLGAPTQITGSLSKDSKQAGYLFQRVIQGNTSVVGATRWYR